MIKISSHMKSSATPTTAFRECQSILSRQIREGYIKDKDLIDSWDKKMHVVCMRDRVCTVSAGPDGTFNNSDDVSECLAHEGQTAKKPVSEKDNAPE
jgi:hypothetical protein